MKLSALVILSLFTFGGQFNAFAQKEVVYEKLQHFNIPADFMEHTIRNAERKYTYYYKLTSADPDGNPLVSIAEYDPRRKTKKRWKLVSVNGGEPGGKGLKEFNRINNVKREEATGRIDTSSFQVLENSDEVFSFSFIYEEGSVTGYRKYLEDCVGFVEIDPKTGDVNHVRFKNQTDTKVRMFRCTYLDVELDLEYMPETGIYVLKNEKSTMTLHIFDNEVVIDEIGEYYDYQLIDDN